MQINNGGGVNPNGAITSTDSTFVSSLQRVYGVGASYVLGDARIGLVWTRTQLDGIATINGANGLGLVQNSADAAFSNYEINFSYRVTPALNLGGEYTYTDSSISAHHPKWHEVSLEADYFFSARSDVYLEGTYQQVIADGSKLTADISGRDMSSSSRQAVIAAGLRHRF
jgi:GBP family porin